MKLIYCEKCGWMFQLLRGYAMYCACEDVKAGKYLDDNLTAVVTRNSIVIGIDNNSFRDCVFRYNKHNPEGDEPFPRRIDFFFTGWIPTIPGEIIKVDTKEEVENFPLDYETGDEYSTMPNSQ